MFFSFTRWLCQISMKSKRSRRESSLPATSQLQIVERLEQRQLLTGTWTAVTNAFPNSTGTNVIEQLSDGSVIVLAGGGDASNAWHRLTPTKTGDYVNGTWSALPLMHLQ